VRAVVLGTAGHIDHGKTSIVAALTGVDCDRLPEEKRRGITLVLGFAPMADPARELEISFIDVPGHERLVHTMIAGAGGIDRALVVVAADEGVMPQTREHLEVLTLLGVRGGVVALTKTDLVDDDLVALQAEELRDLLAGGTLAGAPVVPCSARTGAGIDALREAVLACARGVVRRQEPHRPFRLSADRVFSLPGAGTVVTGTARWGSVHPGDELTAYPSGRLVRVRGVQVHGEARPAAGVGERVALQLAGAAVEELPRGEQLLGAGPWQASRRLAVTLTLLPGGALAEGETVWLHLLAARVPARIERLWPAELGGGAGGRAIVRFARPILAFPGDRVVVRRVSPALTLGGGAVLDTRPLTLRRREAARLAALPDPGSDLTRTLAAWIGEGGAAGAAVNELAGRLGVAAEALEAPLGRLVATGDVVIARQPPRVLVARTAVEQVRAAARAALAEAGNLGVPIAELAARVLPAEASPLRDFYLADLRSGGVLQEIAGRALAGGRAPLEDPLAGRIEAFYRTAGFEAPSPEEAASRLGANPKAVAGTVKVLLERKRLARIGGKWVLHRELLDEVAVSVRGWGVETFDVAAFKDRFSLTRKLAIPLLEWLDSERVTRREGELRRVLKARPDTRSSA
jgi:selenocysteine-specific elongation factor